MTGAGRASDAAAVISLLRSLFRPGNAWRLRFDNKHSGGVLEAADRRSFKYAPPPILEIFKYGTVGRFGRLQVSETNVKRDRAKRPKCSTAIREAAALCCQKSAVFHLPCKWLIDIRCYAWLLLLIRTTTIQASFRNCNAIYRRDMFYRASSAFRQFPFCWATHFARQDSGQIF